MGNGNMRSIGIEICYSMDNGYSGAKSSRYSQAEENAALYIAHVLKQYGWGIDRLKRHYDWSGKDCPHKMHATGTYQAFRNRVQAHLNALNSNASKPAKQPVANPKPAKKPASSKKSTATIVNEVIAGKWGTGNTRFNALKKAGYNAQAVQNEVNRQLGAKPVKAAPKKKSNATIVNEVIAGKWGTGNDRFNRLKKAGYNPTTIQNAVNKKLGAGSSKPAKKSIDTVAREVIAGQWGNGNARFNSLRNAGYNPDTVQRRVNQLL